MTQRLNFTQTNESITVIIDGVAKTVKRDAPNFARLRDALSKEDWVTARNSVTIEQAVKEWAKGQFKVQDGKIFFGKEPVPDGFARRIHEMVAKNESPQPLLNFYERLQKNPSYRSVKQLWEFLQHAGIPITPKGTFLAYKSVRTNYLDHHSGQFDNSPGHTIKMDRNKISDDPDLACHEGFHVGALSYANTFGGGDRRIIVCEVDPEHVVCVPKDESQRKMRVCEYKVIGNHGAQLPSTTFDPGIDDEEEENEESGDEGEAPKQEEKPAPRKKKLSRADRKKEKKKAKKAAKKKAAAKPALKKGERAGPKEGTIIKGKAKDVPAEFAKFEKMGLEELMECHLVNELRPYAAVGLHIVGASKIPGGKTALVAAIMATRKKR